VTVIVPVGVEPPTSVALSETAHADESRFVRLGLNKSMVIRLPTASRDVLLGNPAIVDAVVRTQNTAYLFAKSVGQTNAFFFDADGRQLAPPDHVRHVPPEGDRAHRDERLHHHEPEHEAAIEAELLRGVGEHVGGEDVERHLLAGAQECREQHFAPVALQYLDERRLRGGAARGGLGSDAGRGAGEGHEVLAPPLAERWRGRFDMQVEVTVDRERAAQRGVTAEDVSRSLAIELIATFMLEPA